MAYRIVLCMTAILSLWVCVAAMGAETRLEESNSWVFAPPEDVPREDSLIDLSHLNEEEAGQSGFIRVSEDGDFVRGDGTPIRFWATLARVDMNTDHFTPEQIEQLYRFLAARGVNLIRLFAMLPVTREGAGITEVDQAQIDRLWRHVASARRHGVYAIICPYWAHFDVPASWGIEGMAGKGSQGLLFFNPGLQAAYRQWMRQLYLPTNPYTGVPLKDEPAVALIQVQNEDSLFFWTTQNLAEPQRRMLARRFGEWLRAKYGTLEAAVAAWEGYSEPQDELDSGVVWPIGDTDMVWFMTQDLSGGRARRMRDQVEFLARLQRDFYAEMDRFFREELGCQQLTNATNWRTADLLRLDDVERWTYTACDVLCKNHYTSGTHVGDGRGWRIEPGHFLQSISATREPLRLPTVLKQPEGHPFIVSENAWVHPNRYQTEGPLMAAAYMGLTGMDSLCWFCVTAPTWELDPLLDFMTVQGCHPWYKWSGQVPQQYGMFPANALIHRLGYVRRGRPVVREARPLEALWRREVPAIAESASFDPNQDVEDLRGREGAEVAEVSRLAFLVGPVQVRFGAEAEETSASDLSPYVDPDGRTVRSNTGQIELRYGVGLFRLDAPKAQGVAGFLEEAGGRFELSDVTIESGDEYATIEVVSMDGEPLSESGKVLVQVGTVVRLTGWSTEEATFESGGRELTGERIVNSGRPPWRVMNCDAAVTIANPNLSKATLLDEAGRPARRVAVERAAGGLRIRLPENTMYLIVE